MFQFRLARAGMLIAALGFTIALGQTAHAAVSGEVGKHLAAAQELAKKGKFKEAMAQVNEADHAGGKNAGDAFTIEQMRGYIARSMGDNTTALHSYETQLASGKVPAAQQSDMVKAIAGMYFSLKDYPKASVWINRYLKEGGTDPQMRALLQQVQFQSGNCGQIVKDIQAELKAADRSGRALPETQLQFLANCANKQNDKVTYVVAIEKLVASYPKKDYWADLLNRVQNKPGFSSRLQLDVLRLKLSIGQLTAGKDFMEMGQLALQSGAPAEAMRIIDAGYKNGALGTGAEAERHKRLRDLATKTLAEDEKRLPTAEAEAIKAKDMDSLFTVGFALAQAGKGDKGFSLMQQALSGNLKHPDESKLHLALAYHQAGKKADALKTLKTVEGSDGAADLARYWISQINHPFSG
jgi:hypothetical protein